MVGGTGFYWERQWREHRQLLGWGELPKEKNLVHSAGIGNLFIGN